MSGTARKMVNLSIEETSGVDHPAHLHEGWLVMKAASSEDVDKALAPRKTEDGVAYPAEAYAYVPDRESPSTWKLRLWEDPEQKVTARQVGMAVAALGAGFRGQKVQIPSEDLAGVKAKVRAAWKEAHPDGGDVPPVLKSIEGQEAPVDEDEVMETEETQTPDVADAAPEAAPEDAPEGDDDILKSAPEAVVKMLTDMRKAADEAMAKAAAAEAMLQKERDERADEAAIAKARTAYANLGIDAEKVGPALRRLAGIDADLAKSVEDVLAAANAKAESADIFAEIGKSASGTVGDAYEQATGLAKAAVADGRADTFAQALSDVFIAQPDLYTQYLADQGK